MGTHHAKNAGSIRWKAMNFEGRMSVVYRIGGVFFFFFFKKKKLLDISKEVTILETVKLYEMV